MLAGLSLAAVSGGGCGRPTEVQAPEFDGFGQARRRAPQFLTEAVQRQVRAAQPRWTGIVLHASDGSGDSPKSLERHHRRVLGLAAGLAWHFVIGDGQRVPAGEITVGPRWIAQQDGEALDEGDEAGLIHICLLGEADQPAPPAQLAALDELLNYLLIRFGDLPIRGHCELEAVGNRCPGQRLAPEHRAQMHAVWPRSVPAPAVPPAPVTGDAAGGVGETGADVAADAEPGPAAVAEPAS